MAKRWCGGPEHSCEHQLGIFRIGPHVRMGGLSVIVTMVLSLPQLSGQDAWHVRSFAFLGDPAARLLATYGDPTFALCGDPCAILPCFVNEWVVPLYPAEFWSPEVEPSRWSPAHPTCVVALVRC